MDGIHDYAQDLLPAKPCCWKSRGSKKVVWVSRIGGVRRSEYRRWSSSLQDTRATGVERNSAIRRTATHPDSCPIPNQLLRNREMWDLLKIAGQEHPHHHRPTEGRKERMAPAVDTQLSQLFHTQFIRMKLRLEHATLITVWQTVESDQRSGMTAAI